MTEVESGPHGRHWVKPPTLSGSPMRLISCAVGKTVLSACYTFRPCLNSSPTSLRLATVVVTIDLRYSDVFVCRFCCVGTQTNEMHTCMCIASILLQYSMLFLGSLQMAADSQILVTLRFQEKLNDAGMHLLPAR